MIENDGKIEFTKIIGMPQYTVYDTKGVPVVEIYEFREDQGAMYQVFYGYKKLSGVRGVDEDTLHIDRSAKSIGTILDAFFEAERKMRNTVYVSPIVSKEQAETVAESLKRQFKDDEKRRGRLY